MNRLPVHTADHAEHAYAALRKAANNPQDRIGGHKLAIQALLTEMQRQKSLIDLYRDKINRLERKLARLQPGK